MDSLGGDPGKLSLADFKEVLRFAQTELDLGDQYNSDRSFIQKKMTPAGQTAQVDSDIYGFKKRDDRDICQAVFVRGAFDFQGPAATPQRAQNGAVIIQQGDAHRLIQPEIFERTYKRVNGQPIAAHEVQAQLASVAQ